MLKIAALNEELSQESSESDEFSNVPTKESEEIDSLNLYKEALNHRKKNDFDAALQLFHATLDIPCIEHASSAIEKDNVQSQQLSSTTQIKYACLKSIASLYVLKGSIEEAVEAYLEAVEVDPYDVSVWYQIGKLSVEINNIQLARHAYLQGLTCSPNHWPCLDGLISILYGVGDDLACLLYINRALGKDPFYAKGAILRDLIFESNLSLREDIKKFTLNDKWAPLFDSKCTYEESEKKMFLNEVQQIREAINGQYKQIILDDCHLTQSIPSISWKAVGDCLLNTYLKITEESKAFKLSRPIGLHLQTSLPLSTASIISNDVVDELEVKKCAMDDQNPNISSVGEEEAMDCSIIESQNKSLLHEEDKITNPTSDNTDHDVKPEIIIHKTDVNKRKRCEGNSDQSSERETNQRRSTRSRAYAQQVEEDIYSLRAELRSFLPTSLLLEETSEKIIETPSIETDQKENSLCLMKYPITDESKNANEFFIQAQSSKLGIIALISRYCEQLVLLDGLEWPEELRTTFLEAYHIMRNHMVQLELSNHIFETNPNFGQPSMKNGFGSLIHAEILLYFLKKNPKTVVPPWFMEDITFLFQLADRSELTDDRFQTFQARVYWLYCNWHFHHGRVEEAISILDLVKTSCFGYSHLEAFHDSSSLFSFHTYSTEKMLCFIGKNEIKAMEDILTRTMQLGEIQKLHKEKKFADLVDILKNTVCGTITKESASQTNVIDPVNRPTQLEMLLDGLSNLEDFDQYLIVAEKCLNESTASYLTLSDNHEKEIEATKDPIAHWAKVIERISNDVLEILILRRTSLAVLNRHCLARFAENLVLICSHQLETSDTSSKMPFNSSVFWILLHRVIEFEEYRQNLIKRENDLKEKNKNEEENSREELDEESLPCSILFLISSHDLLGKRSWCMLKNGLFVFYLLEVLLKKRRTTHDPEDREELGRAIEQASYCGLAYPTGKKTKSRSITDHSVEAVSFTWPRVLMLAEYFLPTREELPEFDTVKPTSNAEQEVLLQKIVTLMPPELDPKNRLDDLQSFIQGKQPDIPDYLSYNGMPCEVESVFYLLADYYFKNKDWVKAIENYTLDLALIPARFDSWAALALATGSRLETKLNSCERLKNIGSFLDQAEAALRCFRRALRLRPLQTTLWIEQGSTAYMLSSFCSQLLRNETDALSIELFERLEKERERMLDIAHDCFVAADKSWLVTVEKNSAEEQDERWLHHYMLGKIAEKRAKPFVEFIQHYQRAAELLEESSAAYPRKISYNTPAHLSVEALEIYYRIHSNCLKALMNLQGRSSDEALSLAVFKQLELTAKGCFARGGRRSSVEHKEESEKESAKRKASSKHENESAAKKPLLDKAVQNMSKESRGTNISDVTLILDEIITEVVKIAQSKSFDNTPLISNEEKCSVSSENGRLSPSGGSAFTKEQLETDDPKLSPSTKTLQTASCSMSSDTDDSGSRGTAHGSTLIHSKSASENISDSKKLQEVKLSPESSTEIRITVPENTVMVEMCISAIKDCVSRFPHFYKGLYRLAHYFYHSKVSHNLEACRELLFGRPLSASIAQLQQQQGIAQTRFLPTGVPGLFTEWRSNNFFHGIWRIPVNEIDRPGCFAAHCGRSASLLLDVLKDTRDHRLLMELYLALQPEPEPDKKYLFDSEREQHASLALTLTLQVLKLRFQEIKETPNTPSTSSSGHNTSPQGNSSSKKLSLLMDAFRAYDRVGRNLPGQESIFGSLIVECFKMYKCDTREIHENEASQLEQALTFCRNKQAQSRVRVRGGLAPSLGVVSTRGKRGLGSSRRGSRQSGSNRASSVLDNQAVHNPIPHSSNNPLPTQSSGTVMQEAMKLLQSAGGSADNLPHHLKNIPGIKNLLAMFSESQTQEREKKSAPLPHVTGQSSPSKSNVKKTTPKLATPNVSPATNMSSESLLQSLTGASGSSLATSSALSNIGLMDPSILAMLSNPYINPLNMMGGATGGVDVSSISRMQNEYQQQLMGWMQNALAQSYLLSGFNQSFIPPQSSSGNRSRGLTKSSNRQGGKTRIDTAPSGKVAASVGTSASSSSTSSSSMRTSSSEVKAAIAKVTGTLNRLDSLGETQSSNFKFPVELSEPKVSDKNSKTMPVHEHSGKSKNLLPHTSQKTSSSSSRGNKKLNKGPCSMDSTKFGGLAFDTTGLLGKVDPRGSGKSVINRSKEPTSVSMDFPINLGREITVTATSSSKSTNSGTLPVSSNNVAKTKFSHAMGFGASTSSAPHLLTHSHQLESSFSRPSDPLAFSILQNLPSSMSLLVKSHNPIQSPHTSNKSSGPFDFTSSKPTLPPLNPPPKLTPAPGFNGIKKKKKSLAPSQPSSTPTIHLPSLKAGSSSLQFPLPPSSSKIVNSSSSSSKAANVEEQEKTVNYGDDDVVVLD